MSITKLKESKPSGTNACLPPPRTHFETVSGSSPSFAQAFNQGVLQPGSLCPRERSLQEVLFVPSVDGELQ
eukprot:4586388-Pyramimonas_sp.AAC.1